MHTSSTTIVILHLDSGHDVNGNPMRCFALVNKHGEIIKVIEENYDGLTKVRKTFPDVCISPPIQITKTYYRRIIR